LSEALDLIPIFISWHKADVYFGLLEFNVVNAQAAWLRYLNGTAFASLKKYAAHFSNFAFGETEPKKVPYETKVLT